jgi:hypothetical protein
MAERLTEKQRVAVEALEGARRAGVPLSDYAKAKGLATRPVYDAIAALRRRGALPGTDRPRKRKSKFVAVRVTSSPVAVAEGGRTAHSGIILSTHSVGRLCNGGRVHIRSTRASIRTGCSTPRFASSTGAGCAARSWCFARSMCPGHCRYAMREGLVVLVDDGLALANAHDRGVSRGSIGLPACADRCHAEFLEESSYS